MAPHHRLTQVSSHLNFPQGLFHNQTAIITGAGQGIGAETARLFANEGAKVVIADIDDGIVIFVYIIEKQQC
jgi:3-oxoacyl-[acyl-carrier protein] reductase